MYKMIDMLSANGGLAVLNGSGSQTFPPSTLAIVPTSNGNWVKFDGSAVAPFFDLEVWGGSAVTAGVSTNITDGELFAGVLRAFTLASQNMTSISASTNAVTKNGHGYKLGDGPIFPASTVTLPGGLDTPEVEANGVYPVPVDANSFKLATSRENALAGTTIDITTTGSGTLSFAGTADTQRLYWTSVGMLGPAGDGAFSVDVNEGYRQRFDHRSRCYCYGLVATVSAGTISAALYPTTERG